MQSVPTTGGLRRRRRGPVEGPRPELLPREAPDTRGSSSAPGRSAAIGLRAFAIVTLGFSAAGCPTRAALQRELEVTRKAVTALDASLTRSDRIRARLAEDRNRLVDENLAYRTRIVELERRLLDAVDSRRMSAETLVAALPSEHPWLRERDQFTHVRRRLTPLVEAGLVTIEQRGATLAVVVPGAALFRPGTPRLLPEGKATLNRIVPVLAMLEDHMIHVGGMYAGRPVHSARFRDSRELAVARALAVIHHFVQGGLRSSSLAAVGLPGDATMNGERGRENRLEILIDPVLPLVPACSEPAASPDPAAARPSRVDADEPRRRTRR